MVDAVPLSKWWGAGLTLNQSFSVLGERLVFLCIRFSFLICFFLQFSVGPALICAVDGGKGPQTEREWSPRCTEGWEQKPCHRHSPLVSCRNLNSSSGGYRLLSSVHSFSPFSSCAGHYPIQILMFSCPSMAKTWEKSVVKFLPQPQMALKAQRCHRAAVNPHLQFFPNLIKISNLFTSLMLKWSQIQCMC